MQTIWFSDRGKEQYNTLPGDLFILANAKPEPISEIQLTGRSWSFASVTHLVSSISQIPETDGNGDVVEVEDVEEGTSLCFKIESSKEFEVDDSTSLFVAFLLNLIPSRRICNALQMSGNLKIIKEVLCPDSVAQENLSYKKNNDIMEKGLDDNFLSGLNKAQSGAVLACLGMLHHDAKSSVELVWGPPGTGKTKTIATLLFTLLKMNCRTPVCAPTNVAITEVAARLLKLVTEEQSNAMFCSLGEILLFGDKERIKLKVGSNIEDLYLGHRIQRLIECLGPQTGWRHCFASMINLLEHCVCHYNIYLANELTKEREQNSVCEMNNESRSEPEFSERKCNTFIEYFRDTFVSTATPLKYCISIFSTHISKYCISEHIFSDMVSLILLVDSFEMLLFECNVHSEALEGLFSCSEVGAASELYTVHSIPLFIQRRECLAALRALQCSLSELELPDFRDESDLMDLCFQSASLVLCTASSSFKLHRAEISFTIVVIDEAAQLKECESTIPLQLPGVRHVVLVGDECQLLAMVKSNVSRESGFARSLFDRLSSMGHPKHLLDMQYRMQPSISCFPNSCFYNNRILDAPNVTQKSHEKHYLPGPMFGPYSFINVNDGREDKDENGHSRKNIVEVSIVLKVLRNLYKEWINSKPKLSVGVVSPYAAQVAAIQKNVGQKYDNLDSFKVKVKTVDGFQGGEEDIIIMSTVGSNSHPSLEFISNPQTVNVGITRARHCLWILGNERTLCSSDSVWKALVLDAKSRGCFFNADHDKDLAKAIVDVKKELDQFDDFLNADSILDKVLFSDKFLKSFKKLKSASVKKSALNLLLKLSSGWRPNKRSVETSCGSSSIILKKFKVKYLYIVCTTDIAEDVRYVQVLKVWDILPLEDIPKLVYRLETILNRYTDAFINLCKEKYFEGNLEVPQALEFSRFKDPSVTETMGDFFSDTSDSRSYVENSQVSESLLLMKFYSLSSGVVNHLLSDREGRELDLPFEVTDQEMEIIIQHRSSFIVGRSGTGKTTGLTMKLFQKEQWHHLALQGCSVIENSTAEQSSAATEGKVIRQLFVTVSPKLCFAIKQHVTHLKRFACGGSHSAQRSLIDMIDFDEEESQFKDIQDSFHDIPPSYYPLVITFHKFLMMLDGTLSNSYFSRFQDASIPHDQLRNSRSVAFQAFFRTKEVNYEQFSSLYWPHFNTQLTKNLDAACVFTEIISHIKGGLGAIEACDGKLSQEDYVKLSEGRSSDITKPKREQIYEIFQDYEKMKMGNGEFDMADFVIDLQRRLKHEKYVGDQMDFIYIDEVKDLTMSQLALFKHMCNTVDEGFVFSGDTAQTIARGTDFRFQDIRHLFYKNLCWSQELIMRDDSARKEISNVVGKHALVLTMVARARALSFRPDVKRTVRTRLKVRTSVRSPPSSAGDGASPPQKTPAASPTTFPPRRVHSFRFSGEITQNFKQNRSRRKLEKNGLAGEGKWSGTLLESSGVQACWRRRRRVENGRTSSPLRNQWRVIYDYMKEQDLLDSTLPKKFPSFNEAKHNILCSKLKQLYVAVTRTRQRLWVCETVHEHSKPIVLAHVLSGDAMR
ncbi:hypothetical protein ACLB2K_002143 [Fragaria x ananassa]